MFAVQVSLITRFSCTKNGMEVVIVAGQRRVEITNLLPNMQQFSASEFDTTFSLKFRVPNSCSPVHYIRRH
jgi:hypothetical protein